MTGQGYPSALLLYAGIIGTTKLAHKKAVQDRRGCPPVLADAEIA